VLRWELEAERRFDVTRIAWGAPGARYYEDGVDRGVLYVDGNGYVWNGLVSVAETPNGGEHRSYYLDGIKHLNLTTLEEYEATINAVSSPPEFAECDGTKTLYQGLFATQQRRKPFGFSYRTMINVDSTPDVGYKLHIVYNALAAASDRNRNTRSDSSEIASLSWYIQATPPASLGLGYKPTAHFIVDSRITPGEILTQLEDILYGSEEEDARLPTQLEILNLFEVFATVQVTDNGDGTYTITAPDDVLVDNGDGTHTIDWASVVAVDPDTYTISSL
jgi:hypothetical protein